jgi:Ca2+-binding RTX toxin-like protein
VSGGDGIDTIQYAGSEAISVTLGGGDFEILDAGGATGAISVSVFGGQEAPVQITTGSGNDSIALAFMGDSVDQQVNAGAGNDTVTTVDAGDNVSLEDGDDTYVWEFGFSDPFDWTMDGGAGSDTVQITFNAAGPQPLSIDFSAVQNIGSAVQNFENLDAAGIDDVQFAVIAAASGSTIATGGGIDHVTLGAGTDLVNTGLSQDTVVGALTSGDDIQLGDGDDTFQLTGPVAGGAQADGGEGDFGDVLAILDGAGDLTLDLTPDGTVFLDFEILDGSAATGDINVTVDHSLAGVSTGSGDDTLNLVVEINMIFFGGDTVELGAGNDRADFTIWAIVDGGEGTDTIVFSGDPHASLEIDLTGVVTEYENFENFEAQATSTELFVHASGTGSVIVTGGGDDLLDGAAGNDTLTSGLGTDTFRIDTAPGTDVDVLVDFNPASDFLELLGSAFAGISGVFSLNPDQLALGAAAADADDFLVYDQSTGNLYYDADGNGGGSQVLFAVLSNQAALTAADIIVA